jgi:hypothetical protein
MLYEFRVIEVVGSSITKRTGMVVEIIGDPWDPSTINRAISKAKSDIRSGSVILTPIGEKVRTIHTIDLDEILDEK